MIFIFLIGTLILLFFLLFVRRTKANNKTVTNPRVYWKQPKLASQLSEEQRKEVTEKFLELVKSSKKRNAERMIKIMKERNRLLPFVLEEIRQKPEK